MLDSIFSGRFKRWLPAGIWMLAIFAMSSRSTVPQTGALPGEITAALGHLFVYGVLAVLLYSALEQHISTVRTCAFAAWLGATLYGISDEIHQSFVPGRNASVLDVGIDAIGAAIGLLVLFVIVRARRERWLAA